MLDLPAAWAPASTSQSEEDRRPSDADRPTAVRPRARRVRVAALGGGGTMSPNLTLMIVAGVLIAAGVYLMLERR